MGDEGMRASDMALLLPAFQSQKPKSESSVDVEGKSLEELECEAIKSALAKCDNSQTKAADMLGITLRQIGYKIKKYGI